MVISRSASLGVVSARPAPGLIDRRRQAMLGAGLVLLFVGLILVVGSVPDDAGHLTGYVATVGGALLCAWLGGLLMGRASGHRGAPPGPG